MRVHLQHIKNSATLLKDLQKVFLCAKTVTEKSLKSLWQKEFADVKRQGEIEGLTFDEKGEQFLLLYNRSAKIIYTG